MGSGEGVRMEDDTYDLIPRRQQPIEKQQEGYLGTGLRTLARSGARAAETILGFPGDVLNAGRTAVNFIPNLITGKNIVEPKGAEFGSRDIRSLHEPYTGEYLKPQGEGLQNRIEKASDEFVGDFVSYLIPTGIASKGANLTVQAAKRAAQLAGLSGLAGFVTKEVSGSERA